MAALKKRPTAVKRFFANGAWLKRVEQNPAADKAANDVYNLIRKHRIQIEEPPRLPSGGHSQDGARSAPMSAQIEPVSSIPIEELFSDAKERAGGHGIWLALDEIQDPHNLGAIFRTAGFFGVQGILLTQERSAPLTGTVYDVSSGGVESVPFTSQINLQRAFEVAKDQGMWIMGTSEHAKEPISRASADRPWLIVLGNEERGLRRLTLEACDVVHSIPPVGETVTSLNVSVAAGIVMSRFTS